jgi:hypothetical protein
MLVIGSNMAKMKPWVKIPIDIVPETYVLVREGDGLSIKGNKIGWVAWNEDSTFKDISEDIEIGRSLLVDPHRLSYTWLTTIITEILDTKENYIKFRTSNSIYKLIKLA